MAIFSPQIVKNYQHLVLFIVYCANRFKVKIQGFNKVAKTKTRKKFLESSITPITVQSFQLVLTHSKVPNLVVGDFMGSNGLWHTS